MVIRMMLPVMVRGSSSRENSAMTERWTGATIATGTTGGSGFERDTSASISLITRSASSRWPLDSSQRGDSGIFLRRYHTTRAPTPTITNIQRQPTVGISA